MEKPIKPTNPLGFGIFMLAFSVWVSACAVAPEATVTPTPTPDPLTLGQEVFLKTCSPCHGVNAQGYANELAAPALDASEHAWHHPDQQICTWILEGKLGIGREMPPMGADLSPQEIQAILTYLHSLWTADQLAAQQDVTSRWPETMPPECSV